MKRMKRILSIILAVIVCMSLMTACSNGAASGIYKKETVPELVIAPVGAETPADSDAPTDADAPVDSGSTAYTDANAPFESLSYKPSNYGWSWPKSFGKRVSVEACGFAPTDVMVKDISDPVLLTDPVTVKLDWPDFQPSEVTVTSWDTAVFDVPVDADPSEFDDCLRDAELTESAAAETAEPAEADGTPERTLVLEPNRVYDIYASWDEVKGSSSGNAHYYVVTQKKAFEYVHDPRENAEAMADIIENPDAVYGFSPDPESKRLGNYASYDWTDPEFVAKAKADRTAYHESMDSMTDILYEMREEGASIEDMARAVSEERNRLRLDAYKDDPEGLANVKESNLKTYGHEDGPTPDELYEKYGSWTEVLQRAFSSNMGMDACCGLYDEYYWLYIELGYVEQ